MKILWVTVVFLTSMVCHLQAEIGDPIRDYLDTQAYSMVNIDPNLYQGDELLRLNLDLNHDGQKYILISHNRARSGHQGLIWIVYMKEPSGGYKKIGDIRLHKDGFYLGYVDELQHYGLVRCCTTGASSGIVFGYYIENDALVQRKLGEYDLGGPATMKGNLLRKKYYPDLKKLEATGMAFETIDLSSIAPQYGVTLHPE